MDMYIQLHVCVCVCTCIYHTFYTIIQSYPNIHMHIFQWFSECGDVYAKGEACIRFNAAIVNQASLVSCLHHTRRS